MRNRARVKCHICIECLVWKYTRECYAWVKEHCIVAVILASQGRGCSQAPAGNWGTFVYITIGREKLPDESLTAPSSIVEIRQVLPVHRVTDDGVDGRTSYRDGVTLKSSLVTRTKVLAQSGKASDRRTALPTSAYDQHGFIFIRFSPIRPPHGFPVCRQAFRLPHAHPP